MSNNNKVQRYEWEDSILKAERLDLIPAPSVNLALRLAHAINWVPKDKRVSGLYWDNESALKQVGSSRSTYFRVKGPLFEYGFFIQVKGNLIPQVPDLSQYETEESQVGTDESHIETDQSQVETEESQSDTPYTVDTYSGDSYSVDSSTVDSYTSSARVGDAHTAAPAARLSVDSTNKENQSITPLIGNTLADSPPIKSIPSTGLSLIVEPTPVRVGGGEAAATGPVKRGKVPILEAVNEKRAKKGEAPIAKKATKVIDDDHYEWNGMIVKRAGAGPDWDATPIEKNPEPEKTPCPKCGVPMDRELCWEWECHA